VARGHRDRVESLKAADGNLSGCSGVEVTWLRDIG
jgi:hypothetical protein